MTVKVVTARLYSGEGRLTCCRKFRAEGDQVKHVEAEAHLWASHRVEHIIGGSFQMEIREYAPHPRSRSRRAR